MLFTDLEPERDGVLITCRDVGFRDFQIPKAVMGYKARMWQCPKIGDTTFGKPCLGFGRRLQDFEAAQIRSRI